MKQSLQLKIGQQLVMTPQLQQAIKLLQLSTLDLQQEIQQALDRGIQSMRDAGLIKKAYLETGFFTPAVDKWRTLN